MLNLERLNTFSEFLRTIPPGRFYMGWWFNLNSCVGGNECGTTACALGWACQILEFNKDGLRLDIRLDGSGATPMYGQRSGFDAGVGFFGLTYRQAKNLFSANTQDFYEVDTSDVTPAMVADKIDDIICEELKKNELRTIEPAVGVSA